MLGPGDRKRIVDAVREIARSDMGRLEELRAEIRGMASEVRPIRPRSTSAVSLVSTDAGENVVEFNPYIALPIRVVDSHGQVMFFDVLSPYSDIEALNERQIRNGKPVSSLGRLMLDLGVRTLWDLSPMIPGPSVAPENRPWILVKAYRDLAEWSVLYTYLVTSTFASHTLLVRDGFLRSKIFAGDLFGKMWSLIEEAVREHKKRNRKIMIGGVAKKSKVIDRYHIALFYEGILVQPGPCYMPVTAEMERRAYEWPDYVPGTARSEQKFVAGNLFLAKFGPNRYDPIWPVDIWRYHVENGDVDEVFGYLLADAEAGFPKPHYPLSLQQAHEFVFS